MKQNKDKKNNKIFYPRNLKFSKNWKENLNKKREVFISGLPYKNIFWLSLSLNFTLIILVIIFQGLLPPQLPLFYGQPSGETQLASSSNLILPAVFSLSIIIINSLLSFFLKDDFLRKTLAITGYTTALFAAIAIVKIAFLVGSL